MEKLNLKARNIFIGGQIVKLLNIKFDKEGECKTDWGTKTVEGLGAVITRIVESSVVQFGGEVIDIKPVVVVNTDDDVRNPYEDDLEYMRLIRGSK